MFRPPHSHCCFVRAEEEESCEESGIGDARYRRPVVMTTRDIGGWVRALSSASSGAWLLEEDNQSATHSPERPGAHALFACVDGTHR